MHVSTLSRPGWLDWRVDARGSHGLGPIVVNHPGRGFFGGFLRAVFPERTVEHGVGRTTDHRAERGAVGGGHPGNEVGAIGPGHQIPRMPAQEDNLQMMASRLRTDRDDLRDPPAVEQHLSPATA
jgi:hypothetical protein